MRAITGACLFLLVQPVTGAAHHLVAPEHSPDWYETHVRAPAALAAHSSLLQGWQKPAPRVNSTAGQPHHHHAHIAHHFRRGGPPSTAAPAEEGIVPPEGPPAAGVQDGRSYLLQTAHPGFTMLAQGVRAALSCLHPTFVLRLAAAIADARHQGIPAAIFSACRPPAMHVGGFEDKFRSMHAYGLAVDMTGIGAPGSVTSLRWHKIAESDKVYGVYGPSARSEWNHYQATRILSAPAALRKTITASGPRSLDQLYEVATRYLDKGRDLVMGHHKPGACPFLHKSCAI